MSTMVAVTLALMGVLTAFTAQSAVNDLPAQRLPTGATINLDRFLDDPLWQQAQVFAAFVERTPVNGGTPRYTTSVRVLLSDRDLYVAVRACDPQPELTRARLGPHDSVGSSQDQIMVLIDSVGSRKAAQFFTVNPFGATADGMYTADTDSEDFAPDYTFEARAQRDSTGYTAMFRLPLSTLRFASQDQGRWRMMIRRIMPRDVAYEFTSILIPSSAHDSLVNIQAMEGVDTPTSNTFLRLTPGVFATDTTTRLNGARVAHEQTLAASLDVKWRPLAEVVVDATIHPDFSQVDLDVPQLSGNTRFALSLEEKRPFFQESSDLWQMPTLQLYTRAVTAPDWGLRATRRTDQFAGTLFVSTDRGGGQVLLPGTWGTGYAEQPGSDVAATRVRWDSSQGHLALLAMERRYSHERGANTVIGTDFSHEVLSDVKLRGQVLGSITSAQADANGELMKSSNTTGNHIWLALNQRAPHFENSLQVEQISSGFRNDTGFIDQSGIQTVTADTNRIWRNYSSYAEAWLYASASHARALQEGITVYQFIRPGIYLAHNNGLELTIEPRVFELQRVEPTSSLEKERYLHVDLKANPAKLIPRVTMTLDAGRMTDFVVNRVTPAHHAAVELETLPTRRSSLSVRYEHQANGLFSGNGYTESAVQLKASYALSAAQELHTIVIYRHLHRDADADATSVVKQRGNTLSLSYKYIRSRYKAFYIGITRDRAATTSTSQDTEAYLKGVYDFEL